MKYIKTYERIEYTYKIPAYPLDKYFVALQKLNMTQKDINKWRNNTEAQYWNNSHFKYIIMRYSTDGWSWSEYHDYYKYKNLSIITVEDWEVDAKKYNL